MGNIPTITKNLLIINVLAFAATLVLQGSMGIDLNNIFGLHFFRASDFRVYQLVTYMFMHGGFAHLFFNMFALWMFGVVVEGVWGPRKFLFYYIACGIGAGLMQEMAQFVEIYLQLNSQSPLGISEAFVVMGQLAQQLNGLTTVGASGAILCHPFGLRNDFSREQNIYLSHSYSHQSQMVCDGLCRIRVVPGYDWLGRKRGAPGTLGRNDIWFLHDSLLAAPSFARLLAAKRA